MNAMRYLPLFLIAVALSILPGCTTAFGVGGEDGVGVRSSVGMDGKIVDISPTNGNGDSNP